MCYFIFSDGAPPVFTDCGPAQVTLNKYEDLHLPTPNVTDNSGIVAILEVDFPLGSPVTMDTTVTWRAEDYDGNMATCSVQVTLKGKNDMYILFSVQYIFARSRT